MGSVLGGGGGKSTSTSHSSTKVVLPSYLQGVFPDIINRGTQLSLQDYSPYTGQRVAEFTPDQLAAFQGIRDLQGSYQPMLDQASTLAQQLGQGITPEGIQSFMNPYQQQVIDISKRGAISDFENQLNNIGDAAAAAGAFGGSRHGIVESEARQDLAQRLSDVQTQGTAANYNQAVQTAIQNAGLQGNAVTQALNVAGAGQNLGLGELSALQQAGSQQQVNQQAGLDVGYQNYLQQQAYPYEQLNYLANLALPIGQLTAGQDQTQTTTTKQKSGFNPLSAAIGLGSLALGVPGISTALGGAMGAGASNALGLMGSFSGSYGSQGYNSSYFPGFGAVNWMSEGGKVQKYAKGGPVKKYAEGGLLESLDILGFRENPAGSMDIRTREGRQKLADTEAIKAGNEIAEWAIENPKDAIGLALTAVPLVGPATKLLGGSAKVAGAGAGVAGKGATGLAKLAAKNPKATAGIAGAGLLAIPDGSEETTATEDPNVKALEQLFGSPEELNYDASPEDQTVDALTEELLAESVSPVEQEAFLPPPNTSQGHLTMKDILPFAARMLAGAGSGEGALASLGNSLGAYHAAKAAENKQLLEAKQQAFENSLALQRAEAYKLQVESQRQALEFAKEMTPFRMQKIQAETEKLQAEASAKANPTETMARKMFEEAVTANPMMYENLTPAELDATMANFRKIASAASGATAGNPQGLQQAISEGTIVKGPDGRRYQASGGQLVPLD